MESSSIVTKLNFGLVIAPNAKDTLKRFDALADWMREQAKIDLTAKPADTYKDLAMDIRGGTSDVAWLPPIMYAWLAEGVSPVGSILREGATAYAAAIVVREDSSSLKTLADLKGAGLRAGWVDPWSAAGYVVPRIELARAKIDPHGAFKSETFHGSHKDALEALAKEECDVVGTYARLPNDGETTAVVGAWSDREDHLKVRVLATSSAIPPDVIAVRRNLAPREHEQVMRAFREACADEKAKALVRAVFGGDQLQEGTGTGHDELRRAYEAAMAKGLFD
jgi:phosphate/phosphite/phosphonate ABC transporter binding protein